VIVLGNSDALQVGDQVLAIGNPFGVGQTVTGGIVSALGRNQLGINTFENFIQTDAAINPGNSGGALVDVNGHLMGINTAIYSRSGGSMGIGFAIPVSTAKLVLEGIVKDGVVRRGWIGVEPAELSPELMETFGVKAKRGVLITGVLQNGPAAQAGIRPGDVILDVAGKQVSSVSELLSSVAALKPQEQAQFKVMRRDDALELKVTPGLRPKPKAAPRQQQQEPN
jgi:S1-C subfamily serine protease